MSAHQTLEKLCVPKGLETVGQIIQGYKGYQLFKTTLDMGLFHWLNSSSPRSREEIINYLKINGGYGKSFLQALTDLKLIVSEGDGYANSPEVESFFQGESSQGGEFLKKFVERETFGWEDLTRNLTAPVPLGVGTPEFFQRTREGLLNGEMQAVMEELQSWNGLEAVRSVLDLGGGTGLYACMLAQANPHLQVDLWTEEAAQSAARSFIEEHALSGRVRLNSGDVGTAELGSGYDLVLASHVLYRYRKSPLAFFRRIYPTLRSGGVFVTNHWFCGPGCVPGTSALTDLDQAMQSLGHPLCGIENFGTIFELAGFKVEKVVDIPTRCGPSKLHWTVKGEASEGKTKECC